ncbi:MAG TPA: hypothetical protein VGC65_06085 [Bacteroidia bacterium]|jgi:hypothetical protein
MRILHLILILSFIFILNSCTTTLYTPNTVNAALLKEKGEIKINLDQNNLQTAVAVSDHIGIMANGFFKSFKDSSYKHQGSFAEIGLGYFKPMEEDPVVLELFAGAGIGSVSKSQLMAKGNQQYTANFEGRALKFFVQPEVGFTGKIVDIAFTPRASFIRYYSFHSTNYTEEELAADYLENGRITKTIFAFLEPAITARIGYKWVKLQGQYGMTFNIGGTSIRYPINFLSLGIVVDIAEWYHY